MELLGLLVFLAVPYLANKHPCLKGLDYEKNSCPLFGRPKMYVQKRKYIPKDDFSFDSFIVYEDIMKQGYIDLPWDALAASTLPWDPQEIYVHRTPNEPYPITWESRRELIGPLLDRTSLRRLILLEENEPKDMIINRNKTEKNLYQYLRSAWPIYLSIIFLGLIELVSKNSKYRIKMYQQFDLDEKEIGISVDKRKLLRAKRKIKLQVNPKQ